MEISKLPQTGQLNWPVPVMAMSGMLLFMIGWSMYRGKNADEA
ncbi:MAG: LPXTG cell wall anchor domain-containing protein [Dorea sp.]|nr:LPXTG cell wall anchor domain-containing protein [Dorea sp.]